MFRQWIIFIIFISFSYQAHSIDLTDFGAQVFSQSLNSELVLRDDSDGREVEITPEAPGFRGLGVSYKGIGASYQWISRNEEDRNKKSEASGFKWTVPWGDFLFEYYNTEFEGADVSGAGFRTDIDSFDQGFIVTWARKKDLDFSSIFGLEKTLSDGERDYMTHTIFNVSYQESIWRSDTAMIPVSTGPDDFLAFRYMRRRLTKASIGRTYVKYFDKVRFSGIVSIGPFVGKRLLKYEATSNLTEDEETEWGLGASIGFSIASDYGLKRLGKKLGTHFNYGLNLYAHNASSFGEQNISTLQTAAGVYFGSLW